MPACNSGIFIFRLPALSRLRHCGVKSRYDCKLIARAQSEQLTIEGVRKTQRASKQAKSAEILNFLVKARKLGELFHMQMKISFNKEIAPRERELFIRNSRVSL